MNLGTVVTVFFVIGVAELPDKTMIATLIMGSRGSPLHVWLGAAAAFCVHVALAVAAGQLLTRLPHTTLEIVVTVLFAGGRRGCCSSPSAPSSTAASTRPTAKDGVAGSRSPVARSS